MISAILKLLLVTLAVSLTLMDSSEARPADNATEADAKTTEKPDNASPTSLVSTTEVAGDSLDAASAATTVAPAEADSEADTSEPAEKEVQ